MLTTKQARRILKRWYREERGGPWPRDSLCPCGRFILAQTWPGHGVRCSAHRPPPQTRTSLQEMLKRLAPMFDDF